MEKRRCAEKIKKRSGTGGTEQCECGSRRPPLMTCSGKARGRRGRQGSGGSWGDGVRRRKVNGLQLAARMNA